MNSLSSHAIPDFDDAEMWVMKSTLRERWGDAGAIELQLADVDVSVAPGSVETTSCPAIVWTTDDCNFVVLKIGEQRFRNQFFYRAHEQFGTGIKEYDNIGDCVVTLLRVQADHARERCMEQDAPTGECE